MRFFISLFLISHCLTCSSQNLIVNPSFEDTIPYSQSSNPWGPEAAPPWVTSICGSSPDYFNSNYFPFPQFNNVPLNQFGYQYAKTGIAYCGLGTFVPSNPDHREKFSYTFTSPLIQNHNYYFGFYVSCGDSEKYATDMIGAYFSVNPPDFCLGFIYTPQVNNQAGNILSDTANWVLISGTFTAQGGEKIISIGNFFPDSQTQYSIVNPNASPPYSFAYYYIDDVTLIDCTAVGIKENEPLLFQLLNNPVNGTLQFTTATKVSRCFIYDMLGNKISTFVLNQNTNTYTVSVTDLKQGMHLLILEDNEKRRGVRKFIKQ